jgi:hypothetical protein
MFPFDSRCAVHFKQSGGSTTITAHDAMRVDYAVVSGGCTLSTATGAATNGVISSSFTFNEARASCVLSFTAYFGASSGTVSAASANLLSQTRTVVASSVVFGSALAASPLVAGTAYPFTCEALCVDASLQPPQARLQHTRLRESRPSCFHLTQGVQCISSNPTDQPQSLLTTPCELITPSSAEAAPCQPPPEQLQTALSAAACQFLHLMAFLSLVFFPLSPTLVQALVQCHQLSST